MQETCDYTSLVAQRVNNLCTTRETQVQSLGQEDPLEKEMVPIYWCVQYMSFLGS